MPVLVTNTLVRLYRIRWGNLTNNWPVPTEVLTELKSIKSSHEVIPLNVIDNGIQVLPLDVQGVLRNALVGYMEQST
jgi:hypothetical protein